MNYQDQLQKFMQLPDSVLASAYNRLAGNCLYGISDAIAAEWMRGVFNSKKPPSRPITAYMDCIDYLREQYMILKP